MLLHAIYLACLPLCFGVLRSANALHPALAVALGGLEVWVALNIVVLARAWGALRRAGWADDLCERCLLTGIPVDLWVIRHRDDLAMTPLYARDRLEYDNYTELVRFRGRLLPWIWHGVPVLVVVPTVLLVGLLV